jgi:hypothetical protein
MEPSLTMVVPGTDGSRASFMRCTRLSRCNRETAGQVVETVPPQISLDVSIAFTPATWPENQDTAAAAASFLADIVHG